MYSRAHEIYATIQELLKKNGLLKDSPVLILAATAFPMESGGFLPRLFGDGLNTGELWSNGY